MVFTWERFQEVLMILTHAIFFRDYTLDYFPKGQWVQLEEDYILSTPNPLYRFDSTHWSMGDAVFISKGFHFEKKNL